MFKRLLLLVLAAGLLTSAAEARPVHRPLPAGRVTDDLGVPVAEAMRAAARGRRVLVVFDIDNTPYTSVFNGGRTTENVTIFQKDKIVSATIRSCEICRITGPDGGRQSSEESPPQSLAAFLAGNWQLSTPRTSFVFRFGPNASGTISVTNKYSTNGTISCTGTPENFSCTQDTTTILESGPRAMHSSDSWRKTSATTFSHKTEGNTVFTKF